VLAVGRFGPSRDAALVTRLPAGQALSQAGGAVLPDGTLDELLRTVLRLRGASLAHGALGSETIIVSAEGGVCLKDFRRASSSAPDSRLDGDLAAALAAMAVRVGAERTAAAAARVLDADAARGALVHLQRSALDPVTVDALQRDKGLLPRLRAAAVSSGAIASTASWAAKALLFLLSIGFAAGDFHPPADSGGDQTVIWIVVGIILAAGIVTVLITLVPRLRRLASARIRPHLVSIWANIKTIAAEPRKIFYIWAARSWPSCSWPWPSAPRCTRWGSGPASRRCSWSSRWPRSLAEPSPCQAASASWRRA
jgi:hypothetical protein